MKKSDPCKIIMPAEKSKILKYIQGSKSLKMAHTIFVDIECLVVKHDSCANHLNNSYTKTISTHVPWGYSINLNKCKNWIWNNWYEKQDMILLTIKKKCV